MAFTFVHTADWQIGKGFSRFAPDIGARLRAARLDAIDRIAAVARGAGAAHVLVAGDVIDSELIDDAGLRQPLGRMSAYGPIAWHLLPGNHDPVRPGGVWQRLLTLGVPANVHTHLEPGPVEIEPGVVLLVAPLAAKEMRSDPTAWMDAAATPVGALRIGMAHGSVRGFGSLGEAAVPIEASRRISARLDYLALGDWHGAKEVAAGVWYAGTPEPDSFADNGPGHALVVHIAAAGAPPAVRAVDTAAHRWLARRATLSRLADIQPVEAELGAMGANRRHVVLALALEGAISAREAAALDARIDQLAAVVLALDVDRRRLRTLIDEGDVEALADERLAAVAGRLRARAGADDAPGAQAAARAMRLLLALADPTAMEAGAP